MPTAEILTIGTELLLGEIIDTNSSYIARLLRDHGVNLFYTATVGDNKARIAEAIQQAMSRAEIIITTGGLGPTIDDDTREAVAKAAGVETEFREDLWQEVVDRFAAYGKVPTDNNKRQAYVPQGSIAVHNPVGTAPAFIVEIEHNAIICLPGVPREMEYLLHHEVLPYLQARYDLRGMIKARVIKTAGVGESQIDALISDLEMGHNPTVGLSAHAGQVDVRITAKADSEAEANALIAPVEAELHKRLGGWIFGADEDTLEAAALANIQAQGWKLAVVEGGLGGELIGKLSGKSPAFLGGKVLNQPPTLETLENEARKFMAESGADTCVGLVLMRGEEKQTMHLVRISPVKSNSITRTYGGPPKSAGKWTIAITLDVIRRMQSE